MKIAEPLRLGHRSKESPLIQSVYEVCELFFSHGVAPLGIDLRSKEPQILLCLQSSYCTSKLGKGDPSHALALFVDVLVKIPQEGFKIESGFHTPIPLTLIEHPELRPLALRFALYLRDREYKFKGSWNSWNEAAALILTNYFNPLERRILRHIYFDNPLEPVPWVSKVLGVS